MTPATSITHRLSRLGNRHPRLRLLALLGAPLLWLAIAYLGSLVALLLTSLYTIDSFTFSTIEKLSSSNIKELFTNGVYRTVAVRSITVAALVTIVDLCLALPMAVFLAKVASPRARRALLVAVLMPLWASYLVKAYAWRAMLDPEGGVLNNWVHASPGFGLAGVVTVLSYLWLPYMVLPVYAGLERLPDSMLEASADMGASASRTFRDVILPLLKPSIVAGSIFTFSLSLGDYIAVDLVGGKSQMLGTVVSQSFGASNTPLAAAVALIPVTIMVVYLMAARRTGAFENL
jgi:putative spermidine/putrescine transport system permease protein